jgi:hypothetical protein
MAGVEAQGSAVFGNGSLQVAYILQGEPQLKVMFEIVAVCAHILGRNAPGAVGTRGGQDRQDSQKEDGHPV